MPFFFLANCRCSNAWPKNVSSGAQLCIDEGEAHAGMSRISCESSDFLGDFSFFVSFFSL